MSEVIHAPHPEAQARLLLAGLFQRSNKRHPWRPPQTVLTRCQQEVPRAQVCGRGEEERVTCPLCLQQS